MTFEDPRQQLLDQVNIVRLASSRFIQAHAARDMNNMISSSNIAIPALDQIFITARNEQDYNRIVPSVMLRTEAIGLYLAPITLQERRAIIETSRLPRPGVEERNFRVLLNKTAHRDRTTSSFRIENGKHIIIVSGVKTINTNEPGYAFEFCVDVFCNVAEEVIRTM